MKIIFEGTESQINNLRALIPNRKQGLPVEVEPLSMWSEQDVLDHYHCTKEEAVRVIEEALNGEYISGEIRSIIAGVASILGLVKKEDK